MKELEVPLVTGAGLLVLIGGGEFSFGETKEIDQFLLAHMPAKARKVAFLPTASGSPEYATHLGNWLHSLDPSVQTVNVPIYRGRDARRPKNLDHLFSAGMIYLGGGVTNHLLATLRETPADMAMREAASGGTVVAAIGAAASCFGAWTRDMLRGGGPVAGLGWLPEVVVETGFDPANDTPLRRLMSLPDVQLGLGIPPRTALAIFPGGKTEIVGEGQIAVVRRPR